MSNNIKRRTPGKRVYERPKSHFTLVQPEAQQKLTFMQEVFQEVKEMLQREMNRRRAAATGPDALDAA